MGNKKVKDDLALNYFFRFFGYGNPESPLWFIGIEEGGVSGGNPAVDSHSSITLSSGTYHFDPNLPCESGAAKSPLWAKYRNISMRAGNGPNYFMSNMAPLARPSIKNVLPDNVSWPAYRKLVAKERIPALKSLIQHFQPRAVLFHGKAAWRDYGVRETFGLQTLSGELHVYPNERLLFSPFLLRGFSNENRDRAVDLLSDWLRK